MKILFQDKNNQDEVCFYPLCFIFYYVILMDTTVQDRILLQAINIAQQLYLL